MRLLLDIIPMLASVAILCLFLFTVFGIIGVQLWKDVMNQGCYNEVGELYHPVGDTASYICSMKQSGVSIAAHC